MLQPRFDLARRPRRASDAACSASGVSGVSGVAGTTAARPARPARPRWSAAGPAAVAGLAVAIVAGPATPAAHAGPPIDQWERSWTPPAGGWALADLVAIGADGGVHVSARPEDTSGQGNDIGLIRFAPDGSLEWELIRDGGVVGSEGITDLEPTADGVAAVGVTVTPEGPRTFLLDVAASGALRWERQVLGPPIAGFLAPQLAIGPDGQRVIATDDGAGTGLVAWYTADGEPAGSTPLAFTGFGGVSALEVDARGNAIVVSVEAFGRYSVRSITPDGTVNWTYDEEADGLVLGEAGLDQAPDGGLLVAGTFETACSPEGLAVRVRVWRLSPDGRLDWRTELDAGDCSFRVGTGLVAGSDGAAYLTSQVGVGQPSQLTRLDPDGQPTWTRSFGAGDERTAFTSAVVSSSGDILVGGADFEDDVFQGVRALRYHPDGTLAWTSRVGDGGGSVPVFLSGLAAGPDREMAIVGTTQPAVGEEFGTIIRLDFAACTGDLDDDGGVGLGDVLVLLADWGPASGPAAPADLDQDGEVGVGDLLALLAVWGPCPG